MTARAVRAALVLASCAGAALAAERIEVGRFAARDLSGWETKSFEGLTRYELRDGALCADSRGTASGLFRKLSVDLARTPYLHWSWRIEQGLAPGDEHSKEGDDYAARVYVVFSGGALFWRTRAINYVWSASQPEGSTWPNAFTRNAQMVAVETGTARRGEWVEERRDVAADFRRLFGELPRPADAVAIMTDTDNAGGQAVACYGDIWFAAE